MNNLKDVQAFYFKVDIKMVGAYYDIGGLVRVEIECDILKSYSFYFCGTSYIGGGVITPLDKFGGDGGEGL